MARPGSRWAGAVALLTSIAVALSMAAAGPPAGAATAKAAAATSRPAWHVLYRLAGTNFYSVTASGPDDAWAVGDFWDSKGVPRGRLVHWDGIRWRLIPYPDQRVHFISAAYALSASDVWFSVFGTGTSELLHWSNGSWSTMSLPVNAQNIDVLGDGDIWLVGGTLPHCYSVTADSQGCSVTSHWNGSTWTSYPLRAYNVRSFGGSSASDVWAVGDSWEREKSEGPGRGFVTSFRPAVYRWSGTAWQPSSLALPRTYWAPSVVVRSPHDVFVADATKAHPKACGMRWNGGAWIAFYLHGSTSPCYWAISDYQRGLWFVAAAASPGFSFAHWTGTRFVTTPAFQPSQHGWNTNGFTLAAVPHSSSVWLYGAWCPIGRTCPITGVIAALR
jgi:hypothetical protein